MPPAQRRLRRLSAGSGRLPAQPETSAADDLQQLESPVSGRTAPCLVRASAASPGSPDLCAPKHPFSPPAVVNPRLSAFQLPATSATRTNVPALWKSQV